MVIIECQVPTLVLIASWSEGNIICEIKNSEWLSRCAQKGKMLSMIKQPVYRCKEEIWSYHTALSHTTSNNKPVRIESISADAAEWVGIDGFKEINQLTKWAWRINTFYSK